MATRSTAPKSNRPANPHSFNGVGAPKHKERQMFKQIMPIIKVFKEYLTKKRHRSMIHAAMQTHMSANRMAGTKRRPSRILPGPPGPPGLNPDKYHPKIMINDTAEITKKEMMDAERKNTTHEASQCLALIGAGN